MDQIVRVDDAYTTPGKTVSYLYEDDRLLQGSDRFAGSVTAYGSCRAGQEFDVELLDRGDYRRIRRPARQNRGAIDWLLACPRRASSYPSAPHRRTSCEVPTF